MPRISKAESSRPQLFGGGRYCQGWGHLSPLSTLLDYSDERVRVSDEERKERYKEREGRYSKLRPNLASVLCLILGEFEKNSWAL